MKNPHCTRCKNQEHFHKFGKKLYATGTYQRWQCTVCGKIIIGEKLSDPPVVARKIGALIP